MREENLLAKVRETMTQFQMLNAGDTVVIGVSGGPDSICLLDVLDRLTEEFAIRLQAVHVNHMLRREAQEEEQYVEEFCRQREIPCRIFHKNIKAYAAEKGWSIEEAGRNYRYACFEQVLKQIEGNGRIAVAHHQNDCAETMLFHIIRGTGMKGMAGIPAVRGSVIRPLIRVSRQEILQYLEEHSLRYYIDASNASDDYSRNRIRNQVLPILETVNTQAVMHIANATEAAEEYWRYVEAEAEKAEPDCVRNLEDGVLLLEQSFRAHAVLLQKHLIYRAMYRVSGTAKNLEQVHVEQIRYLFERQTGKRISLPYNMVAFRTYDGVRITTEIHPVKTGEGEEMEPVPVRVPGETRIPGIGSLFCRQMSMQSDIEISKKRYTKLLDYDKICGALSIRMPQTGDYLVADMQGRHKKLARYFIDNKIPRDKRATIPVLASGHQVYWIIGMRISEDVKVTEETRQLLQIEFQFEGERNG